MTAPKDEAARKKPPRRFLVWANVPSSKIIIELAGDLDTEECNAACKEACDTLIGNGDTGWNEVLEDGSEL